MAQAVWATRINWSLSLSSKRQEHLKSIPPHLRPINSVQINKYLTTANSSISDPQATQAPACLSDSSDPNCRDHLAVKLKNLTFLFKTTASRVIKACPTSSKAFYKTVRLGRNSHHRKKPTRSCTWIKLKNQLSAKEMIVAITISTYNFASRRTAQEVFQQDDCSVWPAEMGKVRWLILNSIWSRITTWWSMEHPLCLASTSSEWKVVNCDRAVSITHKKPSQVGKATWRRMSLILIHLDYQNSMLKNRLKLQWTSTQTLSKI